MFTKEAIKLAKPVYEVLKKLGWQWTPEEGEWFVNDGEAFLILNYDKKTRGILYCYDYEDMENNLFLIAIEDVIPILHWEILQEILEKKGYLWGQIFEDKLGGKKFFQVQLQKDGKLITDTEDKTRQVSVMKAVVKLGEIDENKLTQI